MVHGMGSAALWAAGSVVLAGVLGVEGVIWCQS